MSFAQGIQAGLQVGKAIGSGISGAYSNMIQRRIGEELNKDYSTSIEEPLRDQAAVIRGAQNVQAEAQALQGGAPAGQFQMVPPQGGAQAPAAPAAPQGGLRMPQPGAPVQQAAPQAPVPQAPMDAAGLPAQAQMPERQQRRAQNPLQDYLRYSNAARVAAEYGDLELNKAYTDMGKAAFANGVLAWTGKAITDLDRGDTKALTDLLNSDAFPNGLKYEGLEVAQDGSIVGTVIGALGEREPMKLSRDEIMQSAMMLADPKYTVKLYEASQAAKAARAKADRELKEWFVKKNAENKYDWAKVNLMQSQANARNAASIAAANARTTATIAAANQRHQERLGAARFGQMDSYLGNNLDVDPTVLPFAKTVGMELASTNPNLRPDEIVLATKAVMEGKLEPAAGGAASVLGSSKINPDGSRSAPVFIGNLGATFKTTAKDEKDLANKYKSFSSGYLESLFDDPKHKPVMQEVVNSFRAADTKETKDALRDAFLEKAQTNYLAFFGQGSDRVAQFMLAELEGLAAAQNRAAQREERAARYSENRARQREQARENPFGVPRGLRAPQQQ